MLWVASCVKVFSGDLASVISVDSEAISMGVVRAAAKEISSCTTGDESLMAVNEVFKLDSWVGLVVTAAVESALAMIVMATSECVGREKAAVAVIIFSDEISAAIIEVSGEIIVLVVSETVVKWRISGESNSEMVDVTVFACCAVIMFASAVVLLVTVTVNMVFACQCFVIIGVTVSAVFMDNDAASSVVQITPAVFTFGAGKGEAGVLGRVVVVTGSGKTTAEVISAWIAAVAASSDSVGRVKTDDVSPKTVCKKISASVIEVSGVLKAMVAVAGGKGLIFGADDDEDTVPVACFAVNVGHVAVLLSIVTVVYGTA